MTLVSEHIEHDTRERILVVAERLFREIGYQKTTVADIAKVLRMSPANVYRFFDSKKAIHEGVARTLMGGVEDAAQIIAAKPESAAARLRELMTTVHRILYQNDDYGKDYPAGMKDVLGDNWDKYVVKSVTYEVTDPTIDSQITSLRAAGCDVRLYRDDAVFPSADDCAMRHQAGTVARPDDRLRPRRPCAARRFSGA